MVIQGTSSIDKGIQYELARSIENHNNLNNQYRREFKYIKDETLEGKDCIFVKEEIFSRENGTYINLNEANPEKEIRGFWIEKSTGFVLGGAMMQAGQDTATPEMIVRNISFGEVVDSDFELPIGYEIIEKNT